MSELVLGSANSDSCIFVIKYWLIGFCLHANQIAFNAYVGDRTRRQNVTVFKISRPRSGDGKKVIKRSLPTDF
jgi:hypothetical protein